MAGRGTRATATDYNNIQTAIATILGTGSGQNGYGQAVASSQVSAGSVISTTQWANLRSDLSRARVHQTNVAVGSGSASIAANRGSPYQELQIVTSSTTISEDIRDQYSQFSTGVTAQKTLANSGQMSAETAPSGVTNPVSVTGSWGGTSQNQTRTHSFTLTFAQYTPSGGSVPVAAADAARCFFNAGGYVVITSSRTGGTAGSKNTAWSDMLSGFIKFIFGGTTSSIGAGGSLNTGGVVASATGFHQLTIGAAAVQVLRQTAATGNYAENEYIITAERPTSTTLKFNITWRDNDIGDDTTPLDPYPNKVDESVDGTLNSSIFVVRPNKTETVDVPAPTGAATAIT